MGMNKLDVHDSLDKHRTHGFFEDWNEYTSGNKWTTTTAGGGQAAVTSSSAFGILNLAPTDSTQDREVYVETTNSLFALTNNKALLAEAYIQYTEANVNNACIAFGFMSAVGAASMQSFANGNAPKTSFTGAIIYKVGGGTQWKTCSSVGSTQNINQSDTTAGGAAYVRLKVLLEPVSSTICEVTYYVDGNQLKTSGGRPGQTLIKDQLTYTGALGMQLFVCCKNGSTTPETLNVDYIAWEQLRALFTGF